MIDKKELARNLKLLADTPKEIEMQQATYRARLAEIDMEAKREVYGRATLDRWRSEAKETRDKTCHALAHRMRPALEYVAANNNYAESELIDFSNPKLQDALRTVDYMGADLSPADQANIIGKFAGDVGALRVLHRAFSKYNLYMKDACAEMMKPIPQEAIQQMSEVLAFHDYAEAQNRFDFPIERATWTRSAFEKQLNRLQLDTTDAPDCYTAVLDTMVDKIQSDIYATNLMDATDLEKSRQKALQQAELWRIKLAQQNIKEALARGENPASVLNAQLAKSEISTAPGSDA